MTENKGYEMRFDREQQIVKFRFWGFWDAETGASMVKELEKYAREASATGQEWYLLADISQFPAQTEAVQKHMADGMQILKRYGMKKVARIVANTVTKLQISRLSQETHLPENAFFSSEAEAIRWLKSKG